MSALLDAREPIARFINVLQPALLGHFELLATAPGGVARLRDLILALAVQGKLVRQEPNDEAADVLLEKLEATRQQLIGAGRIKRAKPVERVGDADGPFPLPQNWQWIRLGSALEMINGRAFKPSDWLSTGLPIVRIQNLNNEAAAFNYCDPANVERRHAIDSGEFLISWSGTPGTSFGAFIWGRGPAALNQHIFKCELIADVFSPEFLRLAINSQLNVLISRAQGGVGLQHVTKGTLESLVLVLPPKQEQARIVARVDELMRLCDALEAKGRLEAEQHARLLGTLLGTLTDSSTPEELAANWQRVADHFDLLLDRPEAVDALEQTILQLAVRGLLVPQDPSDVSAETLIQDIRAEKDRMIADGRIKRDKPLPPIAAGEKPFELPSGWAWVTLDSLASQITDGAHHTPNYVEAGVPFLSVKDLSSGVIDFSDTRFISSEAHRDLAKRCNPEFGDLLLTKIGTTGIAVVVDTTVPFSLFVSVALIKLPTISARQDYLALVINSPFVRQQSEDGTEGVGNKNLVLRKIRAFRIPLPPLGEQSRIVARVEELRGLCADLRQRITTSQTTQSRLAEALIAEAA